MSSGGLGGSSGPMVGGGMGGILLSGFEANPGNTSYAYIGTILPVYKSWSDSIVQRYWVDHLTYSYKKDGQVIHANSWGGEASLGYREAAQWGRWGVFAGLLYRDTHFSPDDPDSRARGGIVRARFQFEGERIITDRLRASAITSFVPGQYSYWARGRLLYRVGERVSIGPEVIGLGDPDFNIMQYGWVVAGIRFWSQLDIGLKGGARMTDQGTTGYAGIELSHPY